MASGVGDRSFQYINLGDAMIRPSWLYIQVIMPIVTCRFAAMFQVILAEDNYLIMMDL